MNAKKILALILTVTLLCSVMVFTPAVPVAVAEKATYRLLPTADASVSFRDDLLNTNVGSEPMLEIGYKENSPMPIDTGCAGSNRGDVGHARDIMIKFDLGEIDPNTVSSAKLSFVIATNSKKENIKSGSASAVNLAVFEASSDWSEGSVTWNNAPEAGSLAAVSNSVATDNFAVGSAVVTDLTSYIRLNPKKEYSFRIKVSGAGFDFYSKDSGTAASRPVLELETDGQLAPSVYSSAPILEDTYVENSDANKGADLSAEKLMFVAADKTLDAQNGSLYTRNGFIRFEFPTTDDVHYDSAKIVMRAESIANANQEVSLVPVSNELDFSKLTFENCPDLGGDAVCSFVLPNKGSTVLGYFIADLTDYVNSHPSEDGVYTFALTANTAVSHIYTLENEEVYRPKLECVYREKAELTLRSVDTQLNEIAPSVTLTLPVGQLYVPEGYPMSVGESYYFSSEATGVKNTFPYTVQKGKNNVYLIYENKTISDYELVEVTTVQYEAPELPDMLKVIFEGGSDEYYPVSWSQIDPASYGESGSFEVVGTLQGIAARAVVAKVRVLGITGVNVPILSTAPGSYPALPETLSVDLEDGSVRDLLVEWNEIEADSYANVGSFIAYGTIALSNMPIQMTVLVEEGTTDDRIALADAYTQEQKTNFDDKNDTNPPIMPHNTAELKLSGDTGKVEGAKASTARKVFLRFKGSDFGQVYHDPERDDDIDPIVSSKVRLYFNSIANSATVTYKIYGIPEKYDTWQEDTVTWNNSESIVEHGVYISSTPVKQSSFKEGWIELDVTGYVRDNRSAEYLSFYVEADLCAAIITSKEGDIEKAPTLRTTGYIPDASVTLRYVSEIGGNVVDIAESLPLTGKLGCEYEYNSILPNPIFYPEPVEGEEAKPDTLYYYDFLTRPNVPTEDEKDPELYIESLEKYGNQLFARYVKHEFVSVEPVKAETYQGVRPELPDTVTAVLDNGVKLTKNVTWNWDEVAFPDYSTVGSFTVSGHVEHSAVPAYAKITVHPAYFGDAVYQVNNQFDIEAGETYRLSFDVRNVDELSLFLCGINIYDGQDYLQSHDMNGEDFVDYLRSFKDGETVDVYFTAPQNDRPMSLIIPDGINYMTNARLSQVLGRGRDITVHYMADDEEIYAVAANVRYGAAFALSEDYFTVLDGSYSVYGIDAINSAINSLTGSLAPDSVGGAGEAAAGEPHRDIYLICRQTPALMLDASVENANNLMGMPYTRSIFKAYNGTGTDVSATVIVAKFSTDGVLESVTTEKVEIPAGGDAVSTTAVTALGGDSYTSFMVWSDFDGSLIPFTNKVDSRNPSGAFKKPDSNDYIIVPAMEGNIKASAAQSGNEAVNMLTRDSGTRWSAQVTDESQPVYADIDLGNIYDIHTVGLGFYNGKSRYSRFSVDVSMDGVSWDTVIFPRYSSGRTSSVEYYSFEPAAAKYVRVKGYGWKANEITDEGLVEKTGDWFSVTAFEAYGPLNVFSAVNVSEYNDFEGFGTTPLTSDISEAVGGWGAAALNEMDYTDYTPETGGSLYAEIAPTPDNAGFGYGNTALHLYDNVDRDGTDGAGAVGAYHKLSLSEDKYRISFKWYVPNVINGGTYNAQWAGVTLSSGRVKGSADTSDPVALQLRLAPSGKNKMGFNIIRSITYNESNQSSFLGSSASFKANCIWDVIIDVDSAANSIVVTVSDGERTESAFVRYNLYNSERTMSQTWNNSRIDYIMFNTGAGGKCEMYVDDFQVRVFRENDEVYGATLYRQDFGGAASGTKVRTSPVCDTTSALIKESGQTYTASYGTMLDVTVDPQSMTGGRALHLTDFVARDEDSVKGAGGVFAYVDIPEIKQGSIKKIKFDMYAPTAGEFSGFALGHGHNEGGDDNDHPLALQARFSPQASGMQFNGYTSTKYNKGSVEAMVGTGNNRLEYGKVWNFELSINLSLNNITVKATDGSKVSSKTVSIAGSGWKDNPIDTLIFNTGAGSSSDIYIDNIVVSDTGVTKSSFAAVNGLVRYENEYGVGSGSKEGSFLVHGGQEGSRIGINKVQNPYYTRFVERRGLADPDSVSIEVIGLPNCYLVPVTNGSGTIVTVQRYQDSDEFRRRATYNKISSLCGAGNTAYSYQWYADNRLYLRNDGNILKLTHSGDDGVNKACTFHLRNEANNYVSDSFSGNKLSGQWYKGYPWYTNYHNHSAVHRDQNVVVSGGRVLLKATKRGDNEWIKNSSGATGYSDSINGGTWKRYVAWTGVISVNNKVYNKGSYIEGSFKQPNSPRGYWTAFWLNGRDSWPPETDMFEYLSSKGTSTWYTATHGGNEGAGWQYSSAVGNLRTQYHTFAIDWGYDFMRMYVNGSLYFTAPDTSRQKNMYLILNTGIGAWESEPDWSTVWGQGLECQWLRSYQYY